MFMRPRYTLLEAPACGRGTDVAITKRKFKIGQSVRLRAAGQSDKAAVGEYRIVRQFSLDGDKVQYRIRSAADERYEIVVKENDLLN
jgi:hypothetical protein